MTKCAQPDPFEVCMGNGGLSWVMGTAGYLDGGLRLITGRIEFRFPTRQIGNSASASRRNNLPTARLVTNGNLAGGRARSLRFARRIFRQEKDNAQEGQQ